MQKLYVPFQDQPPYNDYSLLDVDYVFHEGYLWRATQHKNGYYSLELPDCEGKMIDSMVFGEPIFDKFVCPLCYYRWIHNIQNVQNGERYESFCPRCGIGLTRKKI